MIDQSVDARQWMEHVQAMYYYARKIQHHYSDKESLPLPLCCFHRPALAHVAGIDEPSDAALLQLHLAVVLQARQPW